MDDPKNKQLRKERLGQLFVNQDSDGILKRKPSYKDIQNSSFSIENSFQKDEIVIINRSRGGFNFGKISSRDIMKDYCIFGGKEIKEMSKLWRVIYMTDDKKQCKDLPSSWIGKMLAEVDESDEKGDGMNGNEEVGKDATMSLLETCVFTVDSKFEEGEKVLVAKEDKGFIIAEIEEKSDDGNCPFDSHDHHLSCWSVSYGEESNEDVSAPLVLKIVKSPSQQPQTPQPQSKQVSTKKKTDDKKTDNKKNDDNKITEKPKSTSKIQVTKNDVIQPPSSPSKTPNNKKSSNNVHTPSSTPKKNVSVVKNNKPIVIIDGPSVASKHRKNVSFSSSGLEMSIKFFERKGHKVIALVPEFYLRRKPTKSDQMTLGEFCNVADNPKLLETLYENNKVSLVPPSCNLHSYIANYAINNKNCIVLTNNRDLLLQNLPKDNSLSENQIFITNSCLSFTFIQNDFIPNPDKYPQI